MANDLSIVNAQVPAHLAGRIGQQSKLAMSLGTGKADSAPPRISIKGGRFRIVQDGAESILDQTFIDVVIVGANPHLSKTFYAKAWDKDAEPAGPDCFSLDGLKPDPSVEAPENDICASCPKNAWGSKVMPNGQQTKACSDQKRLAVVAADDPTGDIYLLQVTPSALKGLNKFQKELSIRGIPPEIVRTKVSFDPDVSYPKLVFSFAGFLDEATQSAVDSLFGSIPVLEITGEKLVERAVEQPVAPKPAPVTPKAEPDPAPAEPKAEAPRGFGASKPAEEPKAEKPKGFGAKSEEPKAAPVADKGASSLADEIAALVDEVGFDDE
jgi:hypothetical protein